MLDFQHKEKLKSNLTKRTLHTITTKYVPHYLYHTTITCIFQHTKIFSFQFTNNKMRIFHHNRDTDLAYSIEPISLFTMTNTQYKKWTHITVTSYYSKPHYRFMMPKTHKPKEIHIFTYNYITLKNRYYAIRYASVDPNIITCKKKKR